MMYQYTCRDCGATVEVESKLSAAMRKYCPECAKERHNHIVNRRRAEGLAYTCQLCKQVFPVLPGQTVQRQYCDKCRQEIKRKPKGEKMAKQGKSTLAKTLAAARAMGMSYGKYQGWLAEQARLKAKK